MTDQWILGLERIAQSIHAGTMNVRDGLREARAQGLSAGREQAAQAVADEAYGHDPAKMVDRMLEAINALGATQPEVK